MKSKTRFFLILTLSFHFLAQGQIIYTKQSSNLNWFSNITEEKGTSNYLVSNVTNTYNSNSNTNKSNITILKLNTQGHLLNAVTLDTNFYSDLNIVTVNSFYYLFGSHLKEDAIGNTKYFIKLIKFDLNFSPVKSIVLDSLGNKPYKVGKLISKQNNLFLGYTILNTTSQAPDTFKLFKLDLNLNKLDSSVSNTGWLIDMENYGDKLLLLGSGLQQGSLSGTNQVAEMDTSFNVNSRFNLDNLAIYNGGCAPGQLGLYGRNSNVLGLGSNRYFVTGYAHVANSNCVFKYRVLSSFIANNNSVIKSLVVGKDSVDNTYMSTAPSNSTRYNYIYSVAMTGYDNSVLVPPQPNNTFILVNKIDTAGNLIWTKYYGGDKYYLPNAIHATSDSGVVICGIRYDHEIPQVTGVCEGFVLKMDKNGTTVFTGIQENGQINLKYHKCFPNPTNSDLTFDLPFQENIEIQIYDINGREVLFKTDYKNLSPLNISVLIPGAYAYKIKTKSNYYSGKFVKE